MSRFLRFAIVGGVGFAVDAGVLAGAKDDASSGTAAQTNGRQGGDHGSDLGLG